MGVGCSRDCSRITSETDHIAGWEIGPDNCASVDEFGRLPLSGTRKFIQKRRYAKPQGCVESTMGQPRNRGRRSAARAASVHHDLVSQFCFAENVTHFHRDLARSLRLEFEIVNLTRVHSHRGVA
jgi:hypothetical protein